MHECRVIVRQREEDTRRTSRKFSLWMNYQVVVASFLFTLFAAAIDIVRRLSTRVPEGRTAFYLCFVNERVSLSLSFSLS